jgi:sulfite exporter TauE/SafE
VTDEPDLTLAFATGLLGALHCLGMCSGIAGGLLVRIGGGDPIRAVLGFHAARILIYALLGIAGAALGRVLVQTGMIGKGQGILMMAAGVLITLIGLDLLGLVPRRGQAEDAAGRRVTFRSEPARKRTWLAFLAGAMNGFVPCSLVFSVAVKAAATADPLKAGMLMAAFGLGTLPTMGLVSLTGAVIGRNARGLLSRLTGLAVVALGLWTFYEGLVFFDIMRGLGNW